MADIASAIAKGRSAEMRKLSLVEYLAQNYEELSKEQRDNIFQELQELGRETLRLFDNLLDDFETLKQSNMEVEEKLSQMAEKLDEIAAAMKEGDFDASECICRQKYAAIWSKLDDASRNFLITANYLCKRCVGEQYDFSPMIVEMSRAYENELLAKIFHGFVTENAGRSAMLQPSGTRDPLYTAVDDSKNGKPFFISLTQMVKIMRRLYQQRSGTYGEKLKNDIDSAWDVKKLSNKSFYDNGIACAMDRNRAAHPGTPLTKADADRCGVLSLSLLTHFIDSMK